MKKHTLLLIVFLMLTFSGFTQFRKGLVVGLNKVSAITPFDGFPVFLYADVSHELQKSFSSYGLEIGINLNKNINLMVEVAFMNLDRKSTRLNSSHVRISYAVFCLKKKSLTIQ